MQTDFEKIASSIPPEKWEASLPIGAFRDLEVLKVMQRPYSLVGRCRVSGKSGENLVYVKKYRIREGRSKARQLEKMMKDVKAAQYWYEHFSGSSDYRVVKPVLSIPEQFITVTEESRGESLYHLLSRDARLFAGGARLDTLAAQTARVGEWLKIKQERMLEADERYDLEALHSYISLRLKILQEEPRRRFPKTLPGRVQAYLDRALRNVPDDQRIVTVNHSDFNPGNILVNGSVVTVLDFGRLVRGSYLLDVSKLHFQLSLFAFKPQFRGAVIRRLQQSLLTGFGDSTADRLQMFELLTVRNILTHLVNITRYWKFNLVERSYNAWVTHRELRMLDRILRDNA